MADPNHFIICSHGFGTAKDDRGLFPDAIALVSGAEIIMFDYGIVDSVHNTVTVAPLSEQEKKLDEVITQTRNINPDAVIDLVCHSMGCVTAALLKPVGIRKTLFLAPPYHLDGKRILDRFGRNPKTIMNRNGTSILARADGTSTIMPKEFWDEAAGQDCIPLYNSFANLTEVEIVNAKQDNVLGDQGAVILSPKIHIVNIDGNHGFTDDARAPLRKVAAEFLTP